MTDILQMSAVDRCAFIKVNSFGLKKETVIAAYLKDIPELLGRIEKLNEEKARLKSGLPVCDNCGPVGLTDGWGRCYGCGGDVRVNAIDIHGQPFPRRIGEPQKK